uniref:Cytoskeleton associated protein 2 n=1 Tax=Pelusios castaneus TaxID=367368 RepID=A0A8C8SF33_9SAUR
MNGGVPPQLPVTRRAELAYREQRRQKVEEYLLRKKAISGLLTQEKQANISNRTGKAASDKLQDKIKVLKSAKQKMEDKENVNRSPWNQSSSTLEKNTASENETLKATTILTNSTAGTNCNPENLSSATNTSKDEAVEIKPYRVSFSQSFLHKRNIKEKQLVADKQNSDVSLPKKHVPGSYCGKVIPSKINSFRKTLENEDAKSLANKKPSTPAIKPAVRLLSTTSSNAVMTNRATNLASAAKSVGATPFQKRPPVRAHSSHSKSIQNKEKQRITSVSVSNMTVQRKPDSSGPPSLKAALPNAKPPSVPGTKRTEIPLRDVRSGTSAKSFSVPCGTKTTQDSKAGNRKKILPKESAEERRIRLAEWKVTKGKVMKRPCPTALQVVQHERETPKEPVESFWATIAEEDEQGLFSENVNKTLVEYLHLTEQGCPGDEVSAMLEKLVQSVPDAKKLAKYWVCRMRLEQMGPIEKVIAVYEEAILAGAQPKDELRHTIADIMKNAENFLKSVAGECMKEEIGLNDEEVSKEALSSSVENVEEVFKELNLNDEEKTEISNEMIKKEDIDLSLKPKQETLTKESKKHRTKEQSKKSISCKTEDAIKDATLEFKTPDKEKEGSYLIKYNLSTTPYLESVKKKMHCEAHDSTVKDLKFLTPVRRSRRLHEKLCKLPDMLKDHDPCVSSLEQLGELGAVTNAFIYRRNSALQEPTIHLEEQEE